MALVAAVLCLVGLELGARVWEWYSHGSIRLDGRVVGLHEDAPPPPGPDATQRRLNPADRQGLALRPGATLDGATYEISINRHGFRGAEVSEVKPPGVRRIWCAGGSTTFDIDVSTDEAAWPAQLGEVLNRSSTGGAFEVINAGVPGEALSTNIDDLRRLGPRLQPDVVLIYQGPNDLRLIAAEKFGPPPPPPLILTELALYRLLSDVLPPPPPRSGWEKYVLGREDMGPLERLLGTMVDEASRQGARPVLMSHAFDATDDATGWAALSGVGRIAGTYRMTPEALVQAYLEMNRLFRDVAERRQLPFIDLRAAVPVDDAYWSDGIHFTDEGAALAAEAIGRELLAAGILSR